MVQGCSGWGDTGTAAWQSSAGGARRHNLEPAMSELLAGAGGLGGSAQELANPPRLPSPSHNHKPRRHGEPSTGQTPHDPRPRPGHGPRDSKGRECGVPCGVAKPAPLHAKWSPTGVEAYYGSHLRPVESPPGPNPAISKLDRLFRGPPPPDNHPTGPASTERGRLWSSSWESPRQLSRTSTRIPRGLRACFLP